MWDTLPEHEQTIPGYYLILPDTMTRMRHARIVLVVRNGLVVHKMSEHMDSDLATIWDKIRTEKKNALVVGGIYREHQQLGDADKNATWLEKKTRQEKRWRRILNRWDKISNGVKCVVIGNLNMDYLKWHTPKQHMEEMVEATKTVVETKGFVQIVREEKKY